MGNTDEIIRILEKKRKALYKIIRWRYGWGSYKEADAELQRVGIIEQYKKRFNSDIPEKKIYSKVHLDKDLLISSEEIICSICGQNNSIYKVRCTSCGNELPKCIICKRRVSGENIVFCPFCSAPYHIEEFFEWLKTKASCPNCKKELDLWDFQDILKKQEQVEENSSKKCPRCNFILPSSSNFCVNCGYQI